MWFVLLIGWRIFIVFNMWYSSRIFFGFGIMIIYFIYSLANTFIFASTIKMFRLFFLSLLRVFIELDNLQLISNRSFDLRGLSFLVTLVISRLLIFLILLYYFFPCFQLICVCLTQMRDWTRLEITGFKRKISCYQLLFELCLHPESLAFCRIFQSYDS